MVPAPVPRTGSASIFFLEESRQHRTDTDEMPAQYGKIRSHGGQVASGVLRHLDWPAIRSSPAVEPEPVVEALN
jgi:hypothetical protein